MATTTPEAIRDRAIAVIESLVPTTDRSLGFRSYRNEGGADFQAWAEAHPASAARRFQVRADGATETPPVSNTDVEEHRCTLRILVAYPQSHRWGTGAALDRDDVLDQDAFSIDKALGMLGAANFTSPHPDATWIEGSPVSRIVGGACDFVELTLTYLYWRER